MTGASRPAADESLTLAIRWPAVDGLPWTESAFVGAYHPARTLRLEIEDAPGAPPLRRIESDHWFLLGTESPLHPGGGGLVQRSGERGVAFRGYLTDPPIHSYSPSAAVADYWLDRPAPPFNGVFAAAVIDPARGRASLTTDALGLGPIYYRVLDGAVLFASNPRLLAIDGDEPDLLAWRSLIESGFIPSDRALSKEVQRVPAGTSVDFDATGVRERRWLDPHTLPRGDRPLDDAGIQEVEDRFREAVGRCLRLENGKVTLPLSSGYDSRRIFGELHRRGIAFDAITARVFQKQNRDLDARFASHIAEDYGVPHSIVEPVAPENFAAHDAVRQQLLDWESASHTWVVQFSQALPREPSVMFDGVLGDILGNPGYRMPGLYVSRENDLQLILDAAYHGEYDRVLAPGGFPPASALRADMARYLEPWMDRINMVEFAFLLLRQRRMTSCWSQQLVPGGHVVVNPYADLDYLSLLLEFVPADKHAMPLQRECLRRFWPGLHRYPGNRDIPRDARPVAADYGKATVLTADRAMRKRLDREGWAATLRLCSRRGRALFRLSNWSDMIAHRCRWFLQPLMAVALREQRSGGVWSVGVTSLRVPGDEPSESPSSSADVRPASPRARG